MSGFNGIGGCPTSFLSSVKGFSDVALVVDPDVEPFPVDLFITVLVIDSVVMVDAVVPLVVLEGSVVVMVVAEAVIVVVD